LRSPAATDAAVCLAGRLMDVCGTMEWSLDANCFVDAFRGNSARLARVSTRVSTESELHAKSVVMRVKWKKEKNFTINGTINVIDKISLGGTKDLEDLVLD
jgi:hypothetical protein